MGSRQVISSQHDCADEVASLGVGAMFHLQATRSLPLSTARDDKSHTVLIPAFEPSHCGPNTWPLVDSISTFRSWLGLLSHPQVPGIRRPPLGKFPSFPVIDGLELHFLIKGLG
jgi:hypothetical protein